MRSIVQLSCLLAIATHAVAVPFPWNQPKHHKHGSSSVNAYPVYPTGGVPGVASYGTAPASSTRFPTMSVPVSSGISMPTGTGVGTGSGTGTAAIPTGSASVPAISQLPPTGTGTGSAPIPSGNSTGGHAADAGFLRGINIGNIFVLERWMDSTNLFSGQFSGASDQWSFDSIDGAEDALHNHWETYFTEDDVKKLKGYGFNALRIPVGYWSYIQYDNEPYITGADTYVERILGWARTAGMVVLIDLHGVPGSQNGQDHSGHSGAIDWQQGDNLQRTTDVLVKIAQKYGTNAWADVVWGIETVNEPTANAPNDFQKTLDWSKQAYDAIQAVVENKNLQVTTHDSFRGPEKFVPIGQGLKTYGADQHNYQLYTDEDNALDQPAHISKACGWAGALAETKASIPVIVGEWSCLSNICVGDDGQNTWAGQSCDGGCQCTSADHKSWNQGVVDQVRRYIEAQLDTYEANSNGFFVWSYKGPGAWGPEKMIEVGAWPQPMTDRKFPGQCGNGKRSVF